MFVLASSSTKIRGIGKDRTSSDQEEGEMRSKRVLPMITPDADSSEARDTISQRHDKLALTKTTESLQLELERCVQSSATTIVKLLFPGGEFVPKGSNCMGKVIMCCTARKKKERESQLRLREDIVRGGGWYR